MSAPTALSAVSPSLADLQKVETQNISLERQPAGKEEIQGTAITDPNMEEVLQKHFLSGFIKHSSTGAATTLSSWMMRRLLPFTQSPSMSRDVKSVCASNTPHTHHTFIVFLRRIQLQSFEDFSMTELSPLLIHSLPSVNENALDPTNQEI